MCIQLKMKQLAGGEEAGTVALQPQCGDLHTLLKG